MFREVLTTKNIVFLILLFLLIKFIPMVSDIAMLFFACFVLACSMLPAVLKIDKKINNRSLSVTIILSAAVVLTLAFILPIFKVTIHQIIAFIQTIPKTIADLQLYLHTHTFTVAGHNILDYINFNELIEINNDVAQNVFSQSLNITMEFAQSILVFVVVITVIFYMLVDTNYMKTKFIEFFPEKMKKKAEIIAQKISAKVGGYVIATIISGAAIWLLIAIILLILRVEYAFSLGLIAGVLDIIPVLGPTIALTLIILTAYKNGLLVIFIAIAAFLGVQQLSNNVIRPIVFGKFMELHPLIIIFSLLVGGKFGGFIGLVFSPAMAAIIAVLIDELYLKTINKKK